MKNSFFKPLLKKPFHLGIAVFIIVLTLTQYLAYQTYLINKDKERKEVLHEINIVKDRIKTSLSYDLSATKTLAFIIENYGFPKDFNKVAKEIINSNKNIDALQITNKGVITHTYPLEGNESAIGYDILKSPTTRIEAYKAIEKRDLFFAGPFQLKQGGMSVVGRLPIFINNEFWGFSVVIIKLSTLLKAAGIDPHPSNPFQYQISKVNPNTNKEEFFLTNSIHLNREDAASINLTDGGWNLYVMSKNNQSLVSVIILSLVGLGLSATSGIFAWHKARQPEKLNRLVKNTTHQIINERNLSQSIINSLPGVFYMYDRNGKFKQWNKNFELITGYTAKEISTMHPLDFFDNDDKELLRIKIDNVFEYGIADVEAHFFTKDKQHIPYYFNGHSANFEGINYLLGVGMDITDRKKAEAEILKSQSELRQLSAHLQTIREEERTSIAREIHDELGQQLTVLKMDASWLQKKVASGEEAQRQKLEEMINMIDDTVKTVRRISSDLRPGILDDLGLVAALEWQSSEFEKRSGIQCTFDSEIDDTELDKNTATGVFRIFQESLTNVLRHAQATAIQANLRKNKDKHIILSIQDNGQGFDTIEVKHKNTLGLTGMRERALMFGGLLSIDSKKEQGTTILLEIPLTSSNSKI